ncbi:SDR family oxidoreductase [Massilia sp. P8910]|uniref:SDR family oxidoreductase n=1 Tax=Massilia antarctica TaxID=2765360 RepID=UPI0006BB8D45|nr:MULTISPECIES: SDR family oxidoreductase [Massilia]MCE3602975.1 SDR family oxidoreductase [Massilia antarctica]MCY0915493.1 SDR family oxidoreductase [Massilia sp. H27-R4]CUI04156.1 Oxidoreductase, short-chain dehydrogenase/reductase family [Janthinobacterium sp. CG23_2]CUU27942.1 Oxidoreductase, short-chain dehydrogenase/reductase family [Janthinobacterium sp. CG23_2]
MKPRLKLIKDQVIVITGATSGIGLTTARMAADEGASLVLAARGRDALDQLAGELRLHGARVVAITADVGVPHDVARIGQAAIERFGRIDTWINNAGVAIFGKLEDVSLQDHQRLFQTNFWGVVHGSLEALKHMKTRGGALINLGSEASDVALPLQAMYSASKHAVKGFTDALRVELAHDGAPVSVTLIKPAAVDTLFTVHAKNYMDREAALPPPIYAPELVAQAILYAARHPRRDVYVGAASRLMSLGGFHLPALMDRYMRHILFRKQMREPCAARVPQCRRDALHAPDPANAMRERQGMGMVARVAESSTYTALSMRTRPLLGALLGVGALFAAWRLARRRTGHEC